VCVTNGFMQSCVFVFVWSCVKFWSVKCVASVRVLNERLGMISSGAV